MDLINRFQEFIVKENLFSAADKLLLAVSGGIDSVVLCGLCQQAGYDFILAHCNFQLRSAESERDEHFVRQLAEEFNKQVLVKRFDTVDYATENKISIQVAARELRYEWFQHLLESQPGLRWLVTAHHLDDNIETMLMNFFKGTGIAGLRGILPKHDKIVRPLLFAKKEELLQWALEHKVPWVEDSSNQLEKYSRNYFRHQIIPLVEKIFPEANNNLSDNLQRFGDIEKLYRQAVSLQKKKLMEVRGNEVHIPVLKLKKTEALHAILYEILKDFAFSAAQVQEVMDLMDSETGRHVSSRTHRVIKNRQWLIIAPHQPLLAATVVIEKGMRELLFDLGTLKMETSSRTSLVSSPLVAQLDASVIQFPLLLRKWKAGDYFYPLGMKKKKKLSRFFIDQKLSKTEKEKVWVLEMNRKIIWVIGQRIDDRFKLKADTAGHLRIELKKALQV